MNMREFSPIFRKSGTIGIICELVGYGCVLACSLLMSDLLERAMAARPIIGTGMLAAGCLLVFCVLGCVLTCWRGRVRLEDTQAFRTFLYRCVIDRRVSVGTPGEMQGKLGGDANTLAAFFQNTLPKAISGAVVILCATALLCMENLLIGSIFFFLNLIQLLPIFLYENWARQIYEQTHSDEEAYCNWMLEGYRGIRTLKAYGMERWFMARYRQLNRAIVDSGKRAEKTGTVENIVFNAVDSLLNYGSYLVVGLFMLCGKAELSRAPYLIVLAGCLFSSISIVFDLRLQQIDSEEACKRLKLRVENVPEPDGQSIIRIHAVTKSYDGKPALQGASLDIREGERILLHGPNGSGKSTLLRLLLGLEEPDSGAGVIAALFRSGCPVIFALTIFVLAALPLARTACMAGIRTRLKKEASEYSEDRKQLEQELFGARDFAKSYSLHGFFVSRLEKRFRAFLQKTGQAQCRMDALVEALDFLSGQGSRLCVVLVGTFQAARGKMELGMLLTGFLTLPLLTQCFAYVRGWISEKHDEAKYLDRISVFYGEFEDGEGIAPALTSLDAENVCFSYSENEKNVLSGIDFHMTGSENMRLAGKNGSGKTTLLSILAGLYEPLTGSVCGGASVGQRRKSTALQEQSGAIFSGTVWENLFLGEDKRPAAEALLEEMGFGKPLGYTVQPCGGNLSPGERKKILLTRAFLRDAPFLLLDEPVNHLDAQATEVVKEKLRQRQGGILLISHRENICEGLGMGEFLMKRKSSGSMSSSARMPTVQACPSF